MAVRCHDCELTHPPRLVFQLMPYLHALLQDLLIEARNVEDMKIRKPGMILALGHWLSRGAVANSKPAGSTTQKRPSLNAEIFGEAQFLAIKLRRCIKIIDSKHERRPRDIRHVSLLRNPHHWLSDLTPALAGRVVPLDPHVNGPTYDYNGVVTASGDGTTATITDAGAIMQWNASTEQLSTPQSANNFYWASLSRD